jgi:hypothetical protein
MKISATLVNILAVIGVLAAVALLTAGGVAIAGGLGGGDETPAPAASADPAQPAVEHDLDDDADVNDGTLSDNGSLDDDGTLHESESNRVAMAAERIAGPGASVLEVDRSDDLGEAYEVEVLTPDGELDIALDDQLQRVPNLRYDD